MKKAIVNIVLTVALACVLCGCGAAKDDKLVDNTVPTALPSPTVTVTPMVTPDVDNGAVTDGDGIIDDNAVDAEIAAGDTAAADAADANANSTKK